MIRLDSFSKKDYADFISWIDSEETLMQVAGPSFRFPLTEEQLDLSELDVNRISFTVADAGTGASIGHGELYVSEDSAKLGRIIIGNEQHRGKGLGQEIVVQLLRYAFTKLNKPLAELNVFDWNTSAIKCYEKVGFTINSNKILERKIKDTTWIAINMVIDRETFEQANWS